MKFGAYDAQGRRKYLSQTEGERFLQASAAIALDKEEVLCKTLYFTGCRMSECLSLGPKNLDPKEHLIRIQTLKKRGMRTQHLRSSQC